jgi:hypothetical protein
MAILDLRVQGPATDRWACGCGMARHELPRGGLAFPGDRREGEPAARASRRWGLACTDAEVAGLAARRRDARQIAGALAAL